MPIGSYCRRNVRTIDASESLRAAAQRMEEEGVGCLVVLEGRRPTGVLTDRDVALRVLRDEVNADATSVREVVPPDPVVVHTDSPLRAAAGVMRRRGLRRLPVVDDKEQLVGLISVDDLMSIVSRELQGLVEAVQAQAPEDLAGADPAAGAAPEVE